ncbi:MAG: hypothetical protein JW394_0374 [Nitrospira sp.]|nr:hypothetical protein [Nitrospira sp.]
MAWRFSRKARERNPCSIFPGRLVAAAAIFASNSGRAGGPAAGIVLLANRSIIVKVRLRRLPIPLAKSLLRMVTMVVCEKSPSCPKGTSRNRKCRNASVPMVSIILCGSTTLPRLFDIFSPLTVHHPWAKIIFGSGRFSAMSIVDQ